MPHTSSDFVLDSSALLDVKEIASYKSKHPACPTNLAFFKKHKNLHKSFLTPKLEIVKCPTSFPEAPAQSKPDWTKAFKNDIPTSASQIPGPLRHENVEQWITENLHPHCRSEERKPSITSLSSTSSCDMYSTVDNSEDEDMLDATPNTLPKATLSTIELIMRKIELNLRYAAYMQCTGSHSSRAHESSSNRGSSGRRSSQSNNGKRKSRNEEHLLPDDPDEDGSNKRRRVSIATTTEDSESSTILA